MGLFDFVKNAGAKIFNKKASEAEVTAEDKAAMEKALHDHIESMGLNLENLNVIVVGDNVKISGIANTQEDKEKALLTVGNVEGVAKVDDYISVKTEVEAPAQFHTVVSGDTLSKLAKVYYGNANDYMRIFEANKPMLSHPDKIYVGQVLRIPQN